MLIALQSLLAYEKFKSLRHPLAQSHEFSLFYDALSRPIEQSQDSKYLIEQVQFLLKLYQLKARSQYTDCFFAPHLAINQLAWQVATLIAAKLEQSVHSVLYSQSLYWPLEKGRWYDYIADTDQLHEDHSVFAIADTGEICQLNDLLDSVCDKFSQGQRSLAELWQGNDARCSNQPLPQSFLHALQKRFPAFKVFYDHIAHIVRTDSPYGKLQELRAGLYNGSVSGTNEATKGTSCNAGPDANEAISFFSPWWEDIRHVHYQSAKSLRAALGELPGGQEGRNLEQLLALIVREQSADISNHSGFITCVQLRGAELQGIIDQNKTFLNSFEKHDLTKQKLQHYKEIILQEFAQFSHCDVNENLNSTLLAKSMFTSQNGVLAYEQHVFDQLWHHFCHGLINEANVIELSVLVKRLTGYERQQLLQAPFEVAYHDKPILSSLCHYLRKLESKLENNCLLPPREQQPLAPMEHDLITLVASNLGLLAMTSSRYEGILFSQPPLVDIAFQYGLVINSGSNRFILQDSFNLAYYIDLSRRGKQDNCQQFRAAFHALVGLPEPTDQPYISRLHQAIKDGDQHSMLAILRDVPTTATHIEWHSGNASLAFAASYGQTEVCEELLQMGADPCRSNKASQVAEELWAKNNLLTTTLKPVNPLRVFHQELMVLAKNIGQLTERQVALLNIVKQYPHLLTWHLKDHEDSFLHSVFISKNLRVINFLAELPNWPALIALTEKNTLSILHLIAARGFIEFFPFMAAIAIDNQANRLKRTALHIAAMYDRTDFCRLLLENQALIDLHDSEGHTALMLAAIKGHRAVFALLLASGADLTVINSRGQTAELLWLNARPLEANCLTPNLRDLYLRSKKDQLLAIIQPKLPSMSYFSWFSSVKPDAKLSALLTAIMTANFDHCPDNWTADEVLDQVLTSWCNQHRVILNPTLMKQVDALIKPSTAVKEIAALSNSRSVNAAKL